MRLGFIIVLGLLLIATTGCGKQKTPEPKDTSAGPMAGPIQPMAVDFEKVEEIAPTGEFGEAVHKDVQPALAAVFGGAKLSGFFAMGGMDGGGSHLVYALKRRGKAEDVEPLKKELGEKGFEFVADVPREQLVTLSFEKEMGEKVCTLTVGLTVDDQRIGIAAFER
jgi:hypothetical protein